MFVKTGLRMAWVVVATCWLVSTAAAQHACYGTACQHGGMCSYGPDGHCAPRRDTYGYYPTVWRQWPGQAPTVAAPRAEPIATPPPAAQDAAPESPQGPSAPDESTEAPPAQPQQPDANLPFELPFDESPAAPSTPSPSEPELPGMQTPQPGPQDAFPTLPPPIQPQEGDAPPTLPDDDPFKDEPPALPQSSRNKEASPAPDAEDAPPQPPKHSGADDPARTARARMLEPPDVGVKPAAHWRVTAAGPAKPHEPAMKQILRGAEPALLPPATNTAAIAPSHWVPDSRTNGNPLRSGRIDEGNTRVRPTALWVDAAPSERVAAPAQKHNPLRNN